MTAVAGRFVGTSRRGLAVTLDRDSDGAFLWFGVNVVRWPLDAPTDDAAEVMRYVDSLETKMEEELAADMKAAESLLGGTARRLWEEEQRHDPLARAYSDALAAVKRKRREAQGARRGGLLP